MGNIVSYLKWRGDLDFNERPFGLVDNLVLSELAYLELSGIVPAVGEPGSITLREASEQAARSGVNAAASGIPPEFLEALGACRRFGTAELFNYVSTIDHETQMQFSALHIRLGDGVVYVAYRGTGDEIVGWREDFSMGYRIMPAQQRAAEYLAQTMTEPDTSYRVGGHSKGGNLALYAAMECPEERQGQILAVYSNDGPGLCPEIIDMAHYERVREKLTCIVPDYCLIGKLFAREAPDLVVKTVAPGVAAHSGFLWAVEGDQFVPGVPNEESEFFSDIFDTWIVSADTAQREVFVRDFFDALEAGGAKTMSELTAHGMGSVESALLSLIRSERPTKIMIWKFLHSALEHFRRIDLRRAFTTRRMGAGVLTLVAGLLMVAQPDLAAKCVGILFGVVLLVLLGRHLLQNAMSSDTGTLPKQWVLTCDMALICLLVTLLNRTGFLTGFTQLIMAICFFWFAYRQIRKAADQTGSRTEQVAHGVLALLSFLLGCLPVTTTALAIVYYTIAAGSVVALYGLFLILTEIYRSGDSV